MSPISRHGVRRGYRSQRNGVFVATLIPHHTHRLYRQKNCSRLPDFVIKTCSAQIRDKYIVRFLCDAHLLGVMLPRMRYQDLGREKDDGE